MSTYYNAQDLFANGDLRFNSLKGLNEVGEPQSKITIKGNVDSLTINALYRNYEHIARNLKVYPTVTIVSRNHKIDGGMDGFYYPQENHIEIIDHDRLVSILAHEMRHAFQYIYYLDIYCATTYNSVRSYLDCYIERDARAYSYDFCIAREYWSEADLVNEDEEQLELVIQKRLSPRSVGLDNKYFRKNSIKGYSISRDYHWRDDNNYEYGDDEYYSNNGISIFRRFLNFIGKAIAIVVIASFLIWLSEEENDDTTTVSSENGTYILENSATEYLTDEDVMHLSVEQLRLARNEIYARHGFIFGSKDLEEYFSKQPWYSPNTEFSDDSLSEIEHVNISLILKYEK